MLAVLPGKALNARKGDAGSMSGRGREQWRLSHLRRMGNFPETLIQPNVELFLRPYKSGVDLSARVIFASSVETHFIAVVRAQLPHGKSLFLLDVRQPESATNRAEAIITADGAATETLNLSPKP